MGNSLEDESKSEEIQKNNAFEYPLFPSLFSPLIEMFKRKNEENETYLSIREKYKHPDI